MFFVALATTYAMMSVSIQPGSSFAFDTPHRLFDLSGVPRSTGRMFDVSPDGKRFVVAKDATDPTGQQSIIVVSHWFDEVAARMRR